jgi:glutamate/tyrosine decarboxylase-like PLP-dependent enzyme
MTSCLAEPTAEAGLPEHGRPWAEIERTLLARRQADPLPREGAPEVYWPNPPDAAFHAAREAQSIYAHFNAFLAYCSLGYASIDRELRAAVAGLFGAPDADHVTLTAGGTEGNFLAVKAARERRRQMRPTNRPNMVLPVTAHPSFDKAGHELGVEVRRVAVAAAWEANAHAMAAAIDDDTVLMVGSVPSYAHGAVDDIPRLGEVALAADVWLHVNAAVGGFLAPYMREIDGTLPPFDAAVPGVRSITADLHKFGFCLNGISTFTLARAEDLGWPRFVAAADVWPVGGYTRNGFLGSRPGGVVAAAWATFQTLGRDGYRAIAAEIAERQCALAAGLGALPGMRVVHPPRLGVLAAEPADPTMTPWLVAGLSERGWVIADIDDPSALQFLLSPAFDVQGFLAVLRDVLGEARDSREAQTSSGHVYGHG